MGSSCLNLAPMGRGTASSMLQQAWPWMLMEISLLLIGATVGSRLAWKNYILLNGESKFVSISLTYPALSSVLCNQPGVRQLRVLPVLHQHISGSPLWPPGPGPHIWWSCGGGRLWEPLLQGLPLPAVETWDSHLHHCKHWQRHNQCIPQGAMTFPIQPFYVHISWCPGYN